jgi:hypothetical protein
MTGLMQERHSSHAWDESMTESAADRREPEIDEPFESDALAPFDPSDQRTAPRFTLLIRAAKLTSPDAEFLCVVRDASESGVSVRLFHPLPADLEFTLELPNGDRHPLERVWETAGKAGFRFREAVALERIVEARGGYAKRPVRLRLEVPCRLVASLRRVAATIANLSQQGAQIRTQEHLSLAQRVRLEIEGVPVIAARVRWRRDDRYGLSFEDTFQFAELAALAFDLQRDAALVRPE